ncbi:DUF2262 domain-containing protein [Lysinibacter cavernae]|uniref:DUF2262 domain-containing protein n=1 Tax=Lysinibacter cavernae TaxID=1640652 RepID=A0A7X5QZK1_9MICO|nr:DUF2262 domain-containing protein [Lysinibacter cavernae]NIH52919.1 hypothetical protein [Lysinibacter cavernae]
MPNLKFHSRAWQHGYWVGRGELNPSDADRSDDDVSFDDGVQTGQAEYGILFEEGEATMTYVPALQSIDDLEAGHVIRVAQELHRAGSLYRNQTKPAWSSLINVSMHSRNYRVFVGVSVAIGIVSLVLLVVPLLLGVVSVLGIVVALFFLGVLALVWGTLLVKSRQGEKDYLTQPAPRWWITDAHVIASSNGQTIKIPLAEITETAARGDFILARHPSHRMIVIPMVGMLRSDTGAPAVRDEVLVAVSTHANTVPAPVFLRAKAPMVERRPAADVAGGTEQQERAAFDAKYASESSEIVVLTSGIVGGAAHIRGGSLWASSTNLLAYVDEDGSVSEKGRLSWLSTDGQRTSSTYDLKPFSQYVVRARRFVPGQTEQLRRGAAEPNAVHQFALDQVIERDVHVRDLDERLARWTQPVRIATDMGEFELDRNFGWFSGHIQWCGRDVSVSLSVDDGSIEGAETCAVALSSLVGLVAAMPNVDSRWRAFAAAELADGAEDWRQDDEESLASAPITVEAFAERIGLSELSIDEDGSVNPYYDDGNMFGGHVILLSVEPDGTITDASIAG